MTVSTCPSVPEPGHPIQPSRLAIFHPQLVRWRCSSLPPGNEMAQLVGQRVRHQPLQFGDNRLQLPLQPRGRLARQADLTQPGVSARPAGLTARAYGEGQALKARGEPLCRSGKQIPR